MGKRRLALRVPLTLLAAWLMGFTLAPTAGAQQGCSGSYTVEAGDVLSNIAQTCLTTVEEILALNPDLVNPDRLFPGQVLRIPGPLESPETSLAVTGMSASGMSASPAAAGIASGQAASISTGAYEVQPGDTLSEISVRAGVSVESLVDANPEIEDPTFILPGMELRIPSRPLAAAAGGRTYTVQEGDTLSEIALQQRVSLSALLKANPEIEDPAFIRIGQVIALPQAPAPTPASPSIPSTGRAVTISPSSGPPGTMIFVTGSGFPAGATLQVGPGRSGQPPVFSQNVVTGSTGSFTTQVTLPLEAQTGETWVVSALAPGDTARTYSSTFMVAGAVP